MEENKNLEQAGVASAISGKKSESKKREASGRTCRPSARFWKA